METFVFADKITPRKGGKMEDWPIELIEGVNSRSELEDVANECARIGKNLEAWRLRQILNALDRYFANK